jgi:hypothetical protein
MNRQIRIRDIVPIEIVLHCRASSIAIYTNLTFFSVFGHAVVDSTDGFARC